MREDVFTIANGDREDVPNYAIVISDGESNVDPEDTLPEAIESRIRGIHIIVVTVTKKPNLEMKGIASDPDDKNILYVENFSMLPDLVEVLIGGMCDGEKYTTWNKNIPHGITEKQKHGRVCECTRAILNRPIAQIPHCSPISHNPPLCNRNVHVCTFLLQNGALWYIFLMHCGICELGLVWLILNAAW